MANVASLPVTNQESNLPSTWEIHLIPQSFRSYDVTHETIKSLHMTCVFTVITLNKSQGLLKR